jgi:hypothetical protein
VVDVVVVSLFLVVRMKSVQKKTGSVARFCWMAEHCDCEDSWFLSDLKR